MRRTHAENADTDAYNDGDSYSNCDPTEKSGPHPRAPPENRLIITIPPALRPAAVKFWPNPAAKYTWVLPTAACFRQNACAVGCAVSSKPTHARRLYAFVRLVRKVIQRRRLLGIRLIWRLRQRWLFGALRVGGCSCVGGRWFGGFVCFRGQKVEHGIAPEERCPKTRLSIGLIAAATSSARSAHFLQR